jgi:hypothetical protein
LNEQSDSETEMRPDSEGYAGINPARQEQARLFAAVTGD